MSHTQRPSHVIFDFDGTLSWLRSGWPDVMVRLFASYLPEETKSRPGLLADLRRDILALNGKPAIHQMHRFCAVAGELGARPPAAPQLLSLYSDLLAQTVQGRIANVRSGAVPAAEYVIAGALPLLAALRERGLRLIILSGTIEPDVRSEAELLGLKEFFGEHIYGATPGDGFSKKQVIDRILHEEQIEGGHLLSFGDGPVEIEFTKAVGGRAVGVASDEHANGSGVVDADKREHLLRAGADAIIPDYRDADWILKTFFA